MSITCISCHQATHHLQPVQADVIQQPESGEWGIDLVLACPHCGRRYGAWVLNWDVVPLSGMTATSPVMPATPHHQTQEGNKP